MTKVFNILYLSHRLDVGVANEHGDTALHYAVRRSFFFFPFFFCLLFFFFFFFSYPSNRGDSWLVKALISLGADWTMKNGRGDSPESEAIKHQKASVGIPFLSSLFFFFFFQAHEN